MSKIISALLLILCLPCKVQAGAQEVVAMVGKEPVTAEQAYALNYAYQFGGRFDMGYTLAAIAWIESRAGLFPVSRDGDYACGYFHVKAGNILKRESLPNTRRTRKIMCEYIKVDRAYAAQAAIDELQYWNDYHNGNWNKMVRSYNGGFKGSTKYLNTVKTVIRQLKKSGVIDSKQPVFQVAVVGDRLVVKDIEPQNRLYSYNLRH